MKLHFVVQELAVFDWLYNKQYKNSCLKIILVHLLFLKIFVNFLKNMYNIVFSIITNYIMKILNTRIEKYLEPNRISVREAL